MQVNLKRPFFGPDGRHFPAGVHPLPDEWEDQLPSTATKLSEEADKGGEIKTNPPPKPTK